MSNIYSELCLAIEQGEILRVNKIVDHILNQNNFTEIKLIYDNYTANKDQFQTLYNRDNLLSKLSEDDITTLKMNIDRCICSILIKYQTLTQLDQRLKRKNSEPLLDEPAAKKNKVNHDGTDELQIAIQADSYKILNNLGFSPNQINSIFYTSEDLAVDVQNIVTLKTFYKISDATICNFLVKHKSLFDLCDTIKKLYELELPTNTPSKLTSQQIHNMIKTDKFFYNSQFLAQNWENIDKENLTLEEIIKIIKVYSVGDLPFIFFYLPALRAKKCPLHCVKNINNQTQKKNLELLYLNFDEMEEYGWGKIENKRYQSLAAQFKKKCSDYSLEASTYPSNEFANTNNYQDIPYYNSGACQDPYFNYNCNTEMPIQSSELSYEPIDTTCAYTQGYQNSVIHSSNVTIQLFINNYTLENNTLPNPNIWESDSSSHPITTDFFDEKSYFSQCDPLPQKHFNNESHYPMQSIDPGQLGENTTECHMASETDVPVIDSPITPIRYRFFTSRNRNENAQTGQLEHEIFNFPDTYPY